MQKREKKLLITKIVYFSFIPLNFLFVVLVQIFGSELEEKRTYKDYIAFTFLLLGIILIFATLVAYRVIKRRAQQDQGSFPEIEDKNKQVLRVLTFTLICFELWFITKFVYLISDDLDFKSKTFKFRKL